MSRQIARALVAWAGGPALHVVALAEPPDLPAPDWLRGARFSPVGGSRAGFALRTLRAAAARRPPTHVVSTHVHLAPLALPSLARGARHVIYMHSLEVWAKLSPLRLCALWSAARLLPNSAYTARRFLAAHPSCARSKLTVCHPAAAEQTVPAEPAPAHPSAFALIVGRLEARERYKGHDLLLELWPEVVHRTGLHLLVAGQGNDRARLSDKARQLGLAESVHFLGEVSDARLGALYRDCEFFAMPGRDEGFGLVYVEAMRAGKACIAGRGAPEEILEHERHGLIVEPGERASVLGAILRLARDPELCARLGRTAQARASAEFSEAAFHRRFLAAAGFES